MDVKKLKVNGYAIQKGYSIPVLLDVRVVIKNGKLTIISTDNEVAVKTYDTTLLPDDDFLVSYSSLIKALKPGSTVSREVGKLAVDKIKISATNPDDYPEIASVKGTSFTVEQADFLNQLRQVYKAASTDNFKPVYNGVCIDIKGGKYHLVATDSRRLSVIDGGACACTKDVQLIVPLKAINILLKTLKTGKLKITCTAGEYARIQFSLGKEIDVVSRLIDGAFPNWRQVIPKVYDFKVQVATDVFTEAIKSAIAILPTDKNASRKIVLSSGAKGLCVSSKYGEVTYADTLKAEIKGDFEFGMNGQFILDALAMSPKSETVTVNGGAPMSPVVVNENHIIMTIKVKSSDEEE